jgi:hypothetical protein
MPEEILQSGGGKSHWIIIAVVVILALYLLSRGSSAQSPNAQANANAAAIEETRLQAAGTAYGNYLAAQTAQIQSGNAVKINAQNVSAAEAIAKTEADAQKYSAHVAGQTSTNNGLIGTIGGIIGGILSGLI